MKKISCIFSFIAILVLSVLMTSCNKLPEGTGVLIVHVTNPRYDAEVRVYPYYSDENVLYPIAKS